MNTTEAKAAAVQRMFSAIAPRYDLLNHLLSLGMDIRWRRRATALFGGLSERLVLDVACGTGDLSITLAEKGANVVGVDFSERMLGLGRGKVKRKKLDGRVALERADALGLPYGDGSFDGVTCAFGIRNFADLEKGLSEMARVLKRGGRLVILEFTTPENPVMAAVYRLYFTKILPLVGGIVSGERSAYEYLPDSVYKFPEPARLSELVEAAGFGDVKFIPFTFGICGVHTGVRR